MEGNELMKLFYERYTTRMETFYRLPSDVDLSDFWPQELAYRKERGTALPLSSFDGNPYFYCRTDRFRQAVDQITRMARTVSDESVFAEFGQESVADEAFYSSIIEGAYSTREEAREFIASGREPKGKDERMILNNYRALGFVLAHLDEPIGEETILRIGAILTEGEETQNTGYRNDPVYVLSQTGETVYTPPKAEFVKPMMDELIRYMNDPEVHPVERAVIAHVYFVTVHPFFDGNGRTARALTYMILLQAGYDFFRMVPISRLLAEERPRYYKALRASQDTDNGWDLTYFAEYYAGLLAGTLEGVERRLHALGKYRQLQALLGQDEDSRLLKGALWMAENDIGRITIEKWGRKHSVSFETARKDLMLLERAGFLKLSRVGRRLYYDLT